MFGKKTALDLDPLPLPPAEIDEHHVRLPDQLASILRAEKAHQQGITGKGIRVAVIDSGFFPHPFYQLKPYDIRRISTKKEPEPHVDVYGHGTAMLASLLSVAPDVEVHAIKCLDKDPSYAIRKALEIEPHVLNCAWGFNIDQSRSRSLPQEFHKLHRLLQRVIESGVCVVAAAGNGQRCFPGNMPEVISAGAVFYSPTGEFEPSDVSSRFVSRIFPDRQVPDICGIAGNRPHGRLLLVPVPPKAKLAKQNAVSSISGWAMFSGTSAATAMVSGAAALLLQRDPDLTPDEIRKILVKGAKTLPDTGCRVMDLEAALEAIELAVEEPVV
jgi:subtilisin family serine protease